MNKMILGLAVVALIGLTNCGKKQEATVTVPAITAPKIEPKKVDVKVETKKPEVKVEVKKADVAPAPKAK